MLTFCREKVNYYVWDFPQSIEQRLKNDPKKFLVEKNRIFFIQKFWSKAILETSPKFSTKSPPMPTAVNLHLALQSPQI